MKGLGSLFNLENEAIFAKNYFSNILTEFSKNYVLHRNCYSIINSTIIIHVSDEKA